VRLKNQSSAKSVNKYSKKHTSKKPAWRARARRQGGGRERHRLAGARAADNARPPSEKQISAVFFLKSGRINALKYSTRLNLSDAWLDGKRATVKHAISANDPTR
jgi:hypothetical protein